MQRRDFVRSVLGTAGAVALSPAFGAEERAPFGLGFSLYGMKTLDLETALRTCAEIGFEGVEFALLPGFPAEPKLLSPEDRRRLRELLLSLKLRVSGFMENLSLVADAASHARNLEQIKIAAQLAHDLSPAMPLPPLETVLGGKPAEWDQIKNGMAEQLRAWATVAAESRLVIALKAHVMSAASTPERVLWLMNQAASPWIKLTYDVSHFELQKLALEETLRAMLPDTRFIHVKDGRWSPEGKVEFLLPGEGTTDYAKYFRLLRELDYRGDVVVEVSAMIWNRAGYDPVAAAKQSFAVLSAARG